MKFKLYISISAVFLIILLFVANIFVRNDGFKDDKSGSHQSETMTSIDSAQREDSLQELKKATDQGFAEAKHHYDRLSK
ncbi:MAG: hypothetical protein K2W94_06225 [Alphaproteobacteria bacterium]|nr:hypothetical protein [Alphaproteobacteria bacterium]